MGIHAYEQYIQKITDQKQNKSSKEFNKNLKMMQQKWPKEFKTLVELRFMTRD